MSFNNLGIKNDMPYGWKRKELWRHKAYTMWYGMWRRVNENKYYKDCKIHENFKLFSNFLKWLENEPRFEEFKVTCHEVIWSIDKDSKLKGNRNYYPEFMSLITKSENSIERNTRCGYPYRKQMKPVIGFNLSNNVIMIFKSIQDVKNMNFNPRTVFDVCIGKYSQHKGYKWKYLYVEDNKEVHNE